MSIYYEKSGIIKPKYIFKIGDQDCVLERPTKNLKETVTLRTADQEIIYKYGTKLTTTVITANDVEYNIKSGLKSTTISSEGTDFVIRKVDKKYRIFVNESEVAVYDVYKMGSKYDVSLTTEIYKKQIVDIVIAYDWVLQVTALMGVMAAI